jgi:hypothetical protein
MNLTLHCHLGRDAFEPLEALTSGWRRCRLIAVVRHGVMMLGAWLSQAPWRHGVDQERQGYRDEPPCNPGGFFDKQRRDEKQRGFEQREPASP